MNKKIASIALILIFILAMIPSIAFGEDRSYSIDNADIQLFVQSDGLLHVKESLFFSFSGEYNGVYRDIPLRSDQSIKDIKIITEGAYSSYVVYSEGDVKRIKIYLYSDPEKTRPISNRNVKVIIEYDFVNAINIYNDVGELHYKIWGEHWDVAVGEVTSTIHFNSSSENHKFWVNPYDLSVENSTTTSSISLKTGSISSGNFFEIRAAIPKSNFENPVYANRINRDGLAEMEKIQKEIADNFAFKSVLYPIIAVIIMILSIVPPIYIYLKYGREPKTQYYGEYEREPPTDDPPALVNALVAGAKDVGDPDIEGFQATIMDLINRKVFSVVPKETEGESLKLKCNPYEYTDFNKFEIKVIKFLFPYNDIVDLKKFMDELDPEHFQQLFASWKANLIDEFLDEKTLKKYFIDKGSSMLFNYGFAFVVIPFVLLFVFIIFGEYPFVWSLYGALLIMGIVGIICLLLPSGIGGRWTEYGKEYDEKWKNFKKYLNDFSLMKEYPPESVAVWNDYLVYATALGVADKVEKAMKMHLPAETLERENVYYYHHYGGYTSMSQGLSTALNYSSSSSSSGGGGSGGGSGGGGGGAF